MTPGQQAVSPEGRRRVHTQPMFHRVFLATPMAVRAVLNDMRSRFRDNVDDDALGRLELVLAEVMNNVTEHGTAPPDDAPARRAPSIHLCIVRHDNGLSCAVTDDGVSLPADCLRPRDLPGSDDNGMPEGGFGWYLIQDLTQALCYYREERRNFLAFCVPFSVDKPPAPLV
ncbi:MAG: ATP-binding protein [Paracoccus sp. (in: a-proteobacteria)]|uniref:ATP-binding protein n=1 Tax=Paracoccus sp. TaxID=267 RepID=UPI0026DF2F64|nr:ATP-binding protein [Paracoccus sp. (in: a-proteobacteria)]MDO5611959.1 ATP-binding protein [Paracoccus sp. (in: a-proteobacteria)]